MKNLTIRILIYTIMATLLVGQTTDPRIKEAQNLESEKRINEAIMLYEKIHKDSPDNNGITYRIAALAYGAGDYKKAAKYYQKLAPNGNPTVLYNLACSLSQAGKTRKALKYLEQAVEKGFNQYSLMKTDSDLDPLRTSDKFEEIMKAVVSIENIPEAQKFDFWVGEWNVYNTQETKVGESRIEKILKNGVILENWYGGSGVEGKSFNHYHIESKKWIQYWVDQSSGRIYFEGNYDPEQKAIVFHERLDQGSEKPLRRLTFFDVSPDSVRQFSQLSSDNGESWSVEYDFKYVRK